MRRFFAPQNYLVGRLSEANACAFDLLSMINQARGVNEHVHAGRSQANAKTIKEVFMKFQTKEENFLEIALNYSECSMNDCGYSFGMLKEKQEPFVSFAYLQSLIADAIKHAASERKYAANLRADAPNSSTYATYAGFYRRHPGVDPELAFLETIQKRLEAHDAELRAALSARK